ncbi:MAG: dihydropteroate synthase [Deltaproteobacteria bacterium]
MSLASVEPTPIRVRGRSFVWGSRTFLMGIINVTPDSFSDGGEVASPEDAAKRAFLLEKEGADIIDIGGESTRPFSEPVPESEEIARVIPAIRMIRQGSNIPISIDTQKSGVADAALAAGADIINDVSAMRFDPGMVEVAARRGAPVIIMHMLGTPQDMQISPSYGDVVSEVAGFLAERARWAEAQGIPKDHIILDPGIGFGKRLEDNLVLIDHIGMIRELGYPVLVGPSRKAFLGVLTGIKNPRERDIPTVGAACAAAIRGADLVRVHDVSTVRPALLVADAVSRGPRHG